ncbi:MAG: CAP domain-containing protein [Bacillota bacterium]
MQFIKKVSLRTLLTFSLAGSLTVCLVVCAAKPARAASDPNYRAPGATGFGPPKTGREECLVAEALAMLRLINQERAQRCLPQLEWDPELTALAKDKSRDMVCYHYFGHLSERLGSLYNQLRRKGIIYRVAGENLVGAPGYRRAQQSLMASPAHRGNILNRDFTKIGIGVAAGGAYRKIFTQIFID